MEEVKKKQNKKTSNTSKVQGVSRKKNTVSELSSDELMEQILAKKKSKKNSSSVSKKKAVSSSNKTKETSVNKKEQVSALSNDELYDLIKSKKKKKVDSSKTNLEQKKEITTSSTSIQNNESLKKDFVKDTDIKSEEKVLKEELRDDLIITREITFTEDKFDLNDKKLLEQLREAIEEFDSLDDTSTKLDKNDDYLFDNVDTKCVDKKNVLKKVNIKYLIVLVLVFIIVLCFLIFAFKKISNEDNPIIKFPSMNREEEIIDVRIAQYEECLKRPLDDRDNTGDILLAKEEFTNYLNDNYKASVMYEDLSLGFSYSYNHNFIYYGASTIKALDALYIYTKAATGEIDLDDTMTYSSKYKWGSSREMSKYDYGQKVTIRNLVKYAVTVSDNSAHQMLVSYIGKSTLKEFGKSLGAKNTLVGSDNFGNISVEDAVIYMKAINDFINTNEELGKELKSYFVQADQNSLEFPDLGIKAAHKYGEYSYYYHDIGIVYADKPYVVAILTLEGKKDFLKIIKDINEHIYSLHQLYYSNRENICRLEVYGS